MSDKLFCNDCKFCETDEKLMKNKPKGKGECRRYPPKSSGDYYAEFPLVFLDCDWCGEFEERVIFHEY